MLARDIMTREVITVRPTTTAKQLARIFNKNQISGAPVVDTKGGILGIVSEADAVFKKGKQVKAIMTQPAIRVTEETPVENIASLMATHKIKRVLVMRGRKLDGIISRADIVRAIALGHHIALHTPIYDL
jgi:CBS domain-containing protein